MSTQSQGVGQLYHNGEQVKGLQEVEIKAETDAFTKNKIQLLIRRPVDGLESSLTIFDEMHNYKSIEAESSQSSGFDAIPQGEGKSLQP
jgi:phage terminase large subunit-like protein